MFHFVSENAQTFARWEKCRKNENLKHSHRKKHFWEITSNFNKLEDRAILIKKFKATICCCDEQHLIRVACALNCDELTQNTGFLRSFHQFHLSTQCLRLCSLDWFNFRILIILFVDNNWNDAKTAFIITNIGMASSHSMHLKIVCCMFFSGHRTSTYLLGITKMTRFKHILLSYIHTRMRIIPKYQIRQ